jgi:LacI family transcriptional regulator
MANQRILLLSEKPEFSSRLGAVQYAFERGDWHIRLLQNSPELLDYIRTWKPAGVLSFLKLRPAKDEIFRALNRKGIPVVDAGWGEETGLAAPRVFFDDDAIGREAAAFLLGLGYRHFAYVGHPDLTYARGRLEGFRRGLAEQGITPEVYLDERIFAEYTPAAYGLAVERRLVQWARALPRPTAVLAANDHQAFKFLEICMANEIQPRERLAVLGVDNNPFYTQAVRPTLSTIPLPFTRLGFEAAKLLDHMMQGHAAPGEPILMQPLPVLVRESTPLLALGDSVLGQALDYIDGHLNGPLKVEEVANAVGVCRAVLHRRFQEHLKRTPLQEIHRRRLAVAQRLLRETNDPIEKVARQCSFASAARFCKIFRQKFGQTPRDYRQQFVGKH